MYTCETGMKAAIMKSTEPTRRKAAATRSDLIEALVALPPACYRRGGRIAPLYHATRRTSAHLCLFTGVPGRRILGSPHPGSCIAPFLTGQNHRDQPLLLGPAHTTHCGAG